MAFLGFLFEFSLWWRFFLAVRSRPLVFVGLLKLVLPIWMWGGAFTIMTLWFAASSLLLAGAFLLPVTQLLLLLLLPWLTASPLYFTGDFFRQRACWYRWLGRTTTGPPFAAKKHSFMLALLCSLLPKLIFIPVVKSSKIWFLVYSLPLILNLLSLDFFSKSIFLTFKLLLSLLLSFDGFFLPKLGLTLALWTDCLFSVSSKSVFALSSLLVLLKE